MSGKATHTLKECKFKILPTLNGVHMMLLLFSRRYIDRYTVPSKDIRKFLQVLYGFFNTSSNGQKKITPKIRGIDMLPHESLYSLCGQNHVLFQDFRPSFLLHSKVIKKKGLF
jgi:hypothetical protein